MRGGGKKPTFNKKKASISIGDTVTVKVKNGKKSAKVTWKTSKKSVAKITKKTAKGNKARATVKGISAGKAKITAVYKLGNKKTRLKCTVTVKQESQPVPQVSEGAPIIVPSDIPGPAATNTPEAVPTENADEPTQTPENPTEAPTGTPKPQVTPDPNKPGIDLSGVRALYGQGKVNYNSTDGSVTGEAAADGTELPGLLIPLGMDIEAGKKVNVTVYGEASAGMRMWLSDENAKRWSEIQDPAEFAETYTLTADNAISGESQDSTESSAKWFQIKGSAYGVNFESIKITKVIVEDPDAPETPTKEPGGEPTDTPPSTEAPSTASPTPTNAPDQRPGIDLSGTKALYGNGTVEAEKDKVTGTKVEGLLIPLGINVDNGRSVRVTVYGEASEGTRMWLSDASQTQYSVIQNPMAFGKEYTLTADKSKGSSSSSYASYIQVKGATPGGTMSSITITKVVVELMSADETPEPKATLAPGMIDLTKPTVIGGTGAYNDATERFEINDSGNTESQVFFELPGNVGTISTGGTVTVTMKGSWNGTNGYRVWIGDGPSGRSNIQIYRDLKKGEFTETFDLTATGTCTRLTIKSIPTWDTPPGGPIDGLSIESIKVEKKGATPSPAPTATPNPTATPDPTTTANPTTTSKPASGLSINLKKENIAYSDAESCEFSDGKMTVKTAAKNVIGIYFNDDHQDIDVSKYKVVVANITSESEFNTSEVRFITGVTSQDASNYGGGAYVYNGSRGGKIGEDYIITRIDYMQPKDHQNPDHSTLASVLSIKVADAGTYTVNSITLLEEDPYESENLNINIKEENLAFSSAKELKFNDGQMDVTLEKGQTVGLYIMDDHSDIDISQYYSFDYFDERLSKLGSTIKSGFATGVTSSDAASLGGGTTVGSQTATPISYNTYWQSRALKNYKIPEGGANASVVYFTNSSSYEIQLVFKEIKLRKYE